jgi:ketosteroid isomerase-like protein
MITQSSAASTAPVRAFFAAFSNGDLEGIVATFARDAEIVAVRPRDRRDGELYGTYRGDAGVRAFVATLGATFETKAFAVDDIIGEGEVAFASGTFTHIVKATGRPFSSAWALRCRVRGGHIATFHFYEDSAAFVEARQ